METTDPALTTLHATARELGVPTAWLKREAESGRVPSLLVGRRRMFSIDAVRDVLILRASAPTAQAGASNSAPTASTDDPLRSER